MPRGSSTRHRTRRTAPTGRAPALGAPPRLERRPRARGSWCTRGASRCCLARAFAVGAVARDAASLSVGAAHVGLLGGLVADAVFDVEALPVRVSVVAREHDRPEDVG